MQRPFRSALEWVAMSSNGDAVTIIKVSHMYFVANKGGNAGTSRP